MRGRHLLKIQNTQADKIVNSITIIILLLICIFTIDSLLTLPEKVPIHFNLKGEPDGVGSKYSLLILLTAIIFIHGMVTVAMKQLHRFNYLAAITTKNTAQQYYYAIKTLRYLRLGIAFLFLELLYNIHETAVGKVSGLGKYFIFLVIAVCIIPNLF